MTEEQILKSNSDYATGKFTLQEIADKYDTTVGSLRYQWRKAGLNTKLSKEARSESLKAGAAKRNSVEANKKREETNLKRYGVRNISQSEEIQAKKGDSIRKAKITGYELVKDYNSIRDWSDAFFEENDRRPTPKELAAVSGYKDIERLREFIHKVDGDDLFSWKESALELYFEEQIKPLGVKYERNNRTVIAPLEIDFWFPEQKVGIEINDVASHNSDLPFLGGGAVKPMNYHQEKAIKGIDMGIRLIHLYEWELYDMNVMAFIKDILAPSNKRISARKCEVVELSKKQTDNFIRSHHLQGVCPGNELNLGLITKEGKELVSVMTFGRPRHSTDYDWELLRYCSSSNITGGASKIFKSFLSRVPKGTRILSFQDMDKFSGNLYDKLGFEYIEFTKPSYIWVKRDDIFKRYSWFVILKKGVDNVLKTNYGKGYNNIELMLKEGYVRVYNSGMRKYVYTKKD